MIASLVAISRDKRWSFLVSPEDALFYQKCLVKAQHHSLIVQVLRHFPALVATMLEKFYAQGIVRHFALRKRAIRVLIEKAYADGIRQCVVIGGGFDSGAYRMAYKHPDFMIYEIDRPLMHSLKVSALQEETIAIPANFRGIAADLGLVKLSDVLQAAPGFDRSGRCLFIAEGVVMYLSEAIIRDLLATIRANAPEGGQFIFTAIPPQGSVRHGFRRLLGDKFLALFGEKCGFELAPEAMPEFLATHGFTTQELLVGTDIETRLALPEKNITSGRQNGEYIVAANFTR